MSGSNPSPKKKRQQPKQQVNLEAMVADCMRDIPSDEEAGEEDDENNPELLAELEEMREMEEEMRPTTTVSFPKQIEPAGRDMRLAGSDLLGTIDERISNYAAAREAALAPGGEASRARRFGRGLATLQEMRRKVLSGAAVNEDDIPPAVVIRKPQEPAKAPDPAVPSQPQPVVAAPSAETVAPIPAVQPISGPGDVVASPAVAAKAENPHLSRLRRRREECKAAALAARDAGDKAGALAGLNAVKECDLLIKKVQSGELLELHHVPGIKTQGSSIQAAIPGSPLAPPARQFSRDDPIQLPENPEDLPPADPATFGAPPPPATVEEALAQRLAKYRQDEAKAKAEGNSSKARRLGRICKQYEDATKVHRAGRPIPVADLPTPPGFAPIPVGAPAATSAPPKSQPAAAPAQGAAGVAAGVSAVAATGAGAAAAPRNPSATKIPSGPRSAREKQLAMLLEQQAMFKAAALEAKKAGQIEQAKEYLRLVCITSEMRYFHLSSTTFP